MGFMFMGRVNGINHYKHGITRTYLYLDDAGNCYLKEEKGGFVPETGVSNSARWRLAWPGWIPAWPPPMTRSLLFGSVMHCGNKGFRF